MSGLQQFGRDDRAAPLLSWRTRANITLGVFSLAAVLLWHAAVFLTARGLGLSDLGATLRALLQGHPLAALGDGVDPASTTITLATFAVLVVVLFAAFVAWALAWGAWRAKRRRGRGLASGDDVRSALGEGRARDKAAQSRAGLTAKQRSSVAVEQVGFVLGEAAGQDVVLPLEDHVLIIAPTGGGKSRDLAIPAGLTAPGALVITSTRADIVDAVAAHRATMGRVFVFDPLGRVSWPESMVWNPVAGCRDGETAIARGTAFVMGLGADDKSSTNSGFFRGEAGSAMIRLLHAADLENRPMGDVIEWAMHLDNGAEDAQDIIRTSKLEEAEPSWAGLLRSVATGADETVASSRKTLMQVVEPLALRKVLRCVTPRPGVPVFDADAFVASTDTLFLIADQNVSTNVAPLCAMLLQEVIDAAKRAALITEGGRIDPTLRVVGDEIANVAPLPKLPDLTSDARGYGMQLVLAIQSLTQGRRRWGSDGMGTMLDNMSAEIVLGGISDLDTLNRYAALVGDVEVTTGSTTYDDTGKATTSNETLADRKTIRADEVRQIPDGHGLLIYRNAPAMLLKMTPWFKRKGGAQVEAQRKTTELRRLEFARELARERARERAL